MSKATKVVKLSADQIDAKLEAFTTTSAKIRFLDSEGWTRMAISKKLNKRYQHVRNVLITPITKAKE